MQAAFPEGRVALVPYLTAGYPTLEDAYAVGEAYVEAGADAVEIGVPFSDPLADGPTIQDTTTCALENGADLGYCLELAAPTTDDERLDKIAEAASGFVYCVSVAGVTGAREKLPPGAVELLRRARARVSVPVVLGFGISSAEAAVEAGVEADGLIIGSKLMQVVAEEGPEGAGAWLREVREALDSTVGAKAGSRD